MIWKTLSIAYKSEIEITLMKKIFHTLLITTLFVSTAAINGMKRLNPYAGIPAQENQPQESLWLLDEVIAVNSCSCVSQKKKMYSCKCANSFSSAYKMAETKS